MHGFGTMTVFAAKAQAQPLLSKPVIKIMSAHLNTNIPIVLGHYIESGKIWWPVIF